MSGFDAFGRMAIMYYVADCVNVFRGWKRKKLLVLSEEISEISQAVPLYLNIKEFKKGYLNKVLDDVLKSKKRAVRLLRCNEENYFYVKGIDKKFTPLHLLAVLEYAVNRVSGDQIENKDGFEHIKMGKMLVGGKK